ncbi:MAG TPA: hydantoinase/oxoprolinase family protein [Methylotenera sp.]|nr:hydantoinase/oxoprolinase family protein [Methylotenera sp.]
MSNMTPNKTSSVIGWDIGGAHLKAVHLDTNGQVISSLQLPCSLWKGLDYLQRAIVDAQAQMNEKVALQAFKTGPPSVCHAITMTGELVDLFENRHQGVCEIAKAAADLLGEKGLFYAANAGFVPMHDVATLTKNIASTNWHASASALALHVQDALFVDIGSTTTDIVAIEGGKVLCDGLSDAYRMQTDSLVYTGVVRTPVMALTQKLDFEGNKTNVAAEYFASMADVYRLTGELAPGYDMAVSADGKGKAPLESARRLARMIGHDVNEHDFNKDGQKWINLAYACRDLHIQQIRTALLKHLKPHMTIIAAGAGSFLVKAIADDIGRHFIPAYQAISMRSSVPADLTTQQVVELCFPAYAVAYLRVKSAFALKNKPC